MDEEEGEAKRTSHPFLLNLPLIFADSESCGFTVMTHVEKKLSLQCPLNGIKATVDESIPPCRIYGCLGWYSITTLVNWALVLVALAPVPTIALMSQRLCWKTHKHTHTRQFRRLPFLITLQNASPSPFCIFACCPACHKGLNSRMQNSLVSPLT